MITNQISNQNKNSSYRFTVSRILGDSRRKDARTDAWQSCLVNSVSTESEAFDSECLEYDMS